MGELVDDKQRLRRELRALLAALPPATKRHGGEAVARHLSPLLPRPASPCSSEQGSPEEAVAFFASSDDELDTRPLDDLLRARGIARALPRIVGDDLVFHLIDGEAHALPRDRFGIPTPLASSPTVALSACTLVVIPGLAFDGDGGRIGYGRGYYDRALAGVDRQRMVAVFLDEQRVDRVPMAAGDVRLPRLCTPARGVVVVDK